MIISEFLPNPIGKDTEGEWIKLFNDGDVAVNLNGWQIKDASGKTFSFYNLEIDPGKYLTLDYKTTKISLNNNGETLFLYDSKGSLIDKAEFIGLAPEGKSFVFSNQTAPKQNFNAAIAIPDNNQNNFINKNEFNFNGLFIGFLSALILAFVFVFIYKKIKQELAVL